MPTAVAVTGHWVCRCSRSSRPYPQRMQAVFGVRHPASPPTEKLRVRMRVGRALCVRRQAWNRSWAGRWAGSDPRLRWTSVAVLSAKSRPTLLGFSCFTSAFQAVLSWRPSSASTSLKVPSTGAADPTAFRYWAAALWMCQEIFPAGGRRTWEFELSWCVRLCKRKAMFALFVHLRGWLRPPCDAGARRWSKPSSRDGATQATRIDRALRTGHHVEPEQVGE